LRLIVDRQLFPGSKINQNGLSKQLKSSRTPIVKALHRLEAQGLVDNIPDRGFFVHELTILELLELYTLREALDSIVVSELVDTITAEQLQQLDQIISNFEKTAEDLDETLYGQCDQEFHSLLLEFSKNNLVKKINDYFQIYNRCFVFGILRKPQETLPEHRKLYEALANRATDEARDSIVSHMANTKIVLQDLVKRLRQVGIDPATIPFKEIDK
jgi:DNA-binding GntR family transcriptional regulator